MPDAFKHLINDAAIARAAAHLRRAWPGFDAPRFTALAGQGLAALEMKARAMQVADALDACLPPDLDTAAATLEAALAPLARPHDETAGLTGWVGWSVGEVVARRVGADAAALPRGLACLHALTQRFTAEFAIRPLLRDHPGAVWPVLMQWAGDGSAAVRRLASEGSRPRLPWGLRLQALVADPAPALPLLARLQDDPDEAVRRSVANHLNDIAKDHPGVLADWLDAHLPGAPPARRALLRHASRTRVKAGDARVLAAWGLGEPLRGQATLAVAPAQAVVGGEVVLTVQLQAAGRQAQALVVDYAIAHAGARAGAGRAPKVFKGWTLQLAPGEARTLVRRHSLRPITTRRYHAGWHPVSLRVNGQVVAEAGFALQLDAG